MLLLFPMLPLTGWAEDEPADADDDRPETAAAERPRLELLRPGAEPEAAEPTALRKTA